MAWQFVHTIKYSFLALAGFCYAFAVRKNLGKYVKITVETHSVTFGVFLKDDVWPQCVWSTVCYWNAIITHSVPNENKIIR